MAERRMFAKTIVLSDAFLDMPMSARCLYFTLGMLADDDGFINSPKSIMRQCGATTDDMKILLAKKFVLEFDTGVIVIKHWRINNYLQKDRYRETKYVEEKELLTVDEKGSYHRNVIPDSETVEEENTEKSWLDARKEAYAESDLPYSFEYKIRNAFNGKPCPVCGFPMKNVENGIHRPTIQHNLPIRKGGKHELSNISVICHSCNVSIRDKETGDLNNAEVVAEWEKLSCIHSDVYTGKDSIGKDSIGKVNKERRFTAPTVEEVRSYIAEKGYHFDAEAFVAFYASKGWKVGSQPMKDWHAACVTWEKRQGVRNTPRSAGRNARPAEQHDYNFDEIERMLLQKQKGE